MKKIFQPIKKLYPLAHRMVMIVMIWSILFTFGATAVQVFLDYRQEIDQLNARLQQTRVIEVPNLVNSVWHFDAKQIEMQLQGMLNLQDIRFVKLEVVGGDTYTAGQIIPASDAIIQTEKLELTQNGKMFTLGQLQIVADIRSLQQRVLHRLLRILAFAAIQIFLLTGVILWVVQRLLTHPLNEISRYAEGLDLEHLEKPLVLQHRWLATRGDELETVTLRLNEMRSRLLDDVVERKKTEAQLYKLNRTYAVLSDVNQAIVQMREAQKLFEKACQIAIEQGGFRMAWIG